MGVLALFGLMLIIMLMRVGVPLGVRIDGQRIGEVRLSFRERVRLQRTNVYLITLALLLGAVSGWLPPLLELAVIAAVFAILAIPTRYVITSEGLALNQVVFRRWSEFRAVEARRGGLWLLARDGYRDFFLALAPARQFETRRIVEGALGARGHRIGEEVRSTSTA